MVNSLAVLFGGSNSLVLTLSFLSSNIGVLTFSLSKTNINGAS